MCFAGNSVVEVTACYLRELPVDILLQSIEVAGEELISIAESAVDLTAGVTALEPRYRSTKPSESLRSLLILGGEGSDDALTTSTADEEFALVFAVEVDEDLTGEEAWTKLEGTRHTRLFVDGEEGFDGAVLDVIRS